MSTAAVITRTLYPSSYSESPDSSSSSSVRAPTTITHLVTKTLASDIPTDGPPSDFSAGSGTTSGLTIGLAIGLPVGLFCLGLVVFLFYFYWKDTRFDLETPRIEAQQAPRQKEKGWLSSVLHGGDDLDDNGSYLNVKRLPSMSSKIQYKISRPIPQHIQTPKAPLCKERDNTLHSLEVSDDVDALLYSRPPNIYHIDSKMPSTNNLPGASGLSCEEHQSLPSAHTAARSYEKSSRKWNYQSPLSRWFLRSSTYLQDGFALPASIKTPTVQLKQLKILSRIHKDYADSSKLFDDEKSPILDRSGETYDFSGSPEISDSTNDVKVQTPSSALYGTIDPQVFEVVDDDWATAGDLELDPVPSNVNKSGRKRKKRRQSRLGKHLRQVTDVKPLPVVPKPATEYDARLRVGYVYKVAQEYNARLTDEIHIEVGEFAKILATHTDGWCLVEKCTCEGNSYTQNLQGKNVNDKGYLNENRGIIPGDCLE